MLIPDILDAAGIDIRVGQGDEVYICCPFCPDRGETADTRFRLGVNLGDGRAHCFNCDWKGRTVGYTARMLAAAFGLKFNSRKAIEERKQKRKPKPELPVSAGLPEGYETFSGGTDSIMAKARAYLTGRGVSTLQIVTHRIGYATYGSMGWRVIFPVLGEKGAILGAVGRDFSGKQTPKYLNTPGVKHLWNGVRGSASTAVVVEGVIDGLRVEQALMRRKDMQAVVRLGSAITPNQLDQLKEFERVLILPDWDRAGVVAAAELCKRCHLRGITTLVSIPEVLDGRDPGDMTEEGIMDAIYAAVPWKDQTEHRLKLAGSREVVFD